MSYLIHVISFQLTWPQKSGEYFVIENTEYNEMSATYIGKHSIFTYSKYYYYYCALSESTNFICVKKNLNANVHENVH